MRTLISILIALVGTSSIAFAGNDWAETRNGGYVVLCPSQPAQVLDLYEAKNIHGLSLDSKASGNLEQHFSRLLSKIARLDAERALLYNTWFQDFFNEVQYISDSNFYPIPDVGYTVIAKNCRLELAIFQRAPSIFNKSRYRINQDLWQQLDEANKAALVLHELIYREYTTFGTGIDTSEPTRFLNAWVNSTEFESLDLQTYLTMLQEAQFKEFFYQDFRIDLGTWLPLTREWNRHFMTFHDSSHIRAARFSAVPLSAQEFLKPLQECLRSDVVELNGEVTFGRQANVEKLAVFFVKAPCLYKYNGTSGRYDIKSDKAILLNDGSYELSGLYNANDVLRVNEKTFIFSKETSQRARFLFDARGEVQKLFLENKACLTSNGHSIVVTSELAEVEFDMSAKKDLKIPFCLN
ncbi:hypothetical protein [Bdellovibrio sp. HCB2-146]|uniref:hypothetical protein n=1 Tax=Bdellovibrio sp. HCB2-146 TaxID=3394362 RepID=UPI0039BC94D7